MSYISIINILGWILGIEGLLMVPPLVCGWIYQESAGWSFGVCIVLCAICFVVMTRIKPKTRSFYVREGYVTVALAWILMSLIGALPFFISREIPSYLDALFEIVSGFTTTGASILSDVEALSHCLLFWRSFSHWVGGMGILVFALSIVPLAGGGSGFSLMQAESPGPLVSKLVPHLKASARHLYLIYSSLTALQAVLMLLGGMPLFETLCTALGTAGTGGFGVLNDSIGSYSTYLQVVITVFMVLFGINFEFFFLLVIRRAKKAWQMEEVRWYLGIYAAVTLLIALNLVFVQGGSFWYDLQQSAFQVASVMTTTGFSTCDFDLWPVFSKTLMLLVMFIGACAGSTGGGLKVSRIVLYAKAGIREARTLAHPREVRAVRMSGHNVERAVLRGTMMFLGCYVILYALSVIVVALDCQDFETVFTAVAATFNNIGPGMAQVGPTCNFGFFTPLSKCVFIFDMLAGRLEIFPILILFVPATWRK